MSESLGLGKIITTAQHKDAIHIAVVPMIAATRLKPGQKVGFVERGNTEIVGVTGKTIGVVDPYLETDVHKGERFWLFLNPGSIVSLRHEWTHPAFDDEHEWQATDVLTGRAQSRDWLKHFAKEASVDFEEMMSGAKICASDSDEWLSREGEFETARSLYTHQFWEHYERVTGEKVPQEKRRNFFSCSC